MPETTKSNTGNVQATNFNMIRAIVNDSALSYNNRIPEITQENIASIYETILNVEPIRNQFVESLIGMVMIQRIEYTYFRNPLGVLKKDPMRYGVSEEEIYVNFAKGYTFDMYATASDLYKYYKASIMTAYHKLTPPMQYAVTITFDNLRMAFRDEYGIRDLINAKVQSLVSGAEWDEYLIMKEIIDSAYASGHLYPVHVNAPVDEATSKRFTVLLKTYVTSMKFPRPAFNIAGADSSASDSSVYMMLTPEVDAQLDVDVLAYAFNENRATVQARKIIVDKFDHPGIKAIVFDMRFFNVRENFRTMSTAENGASLTWNKFYTVSEMFSYSPFFPVVVLTTDAISLASITVSDITAKAGNEYTITALASAENDATGDYVIPSNFRYELTGNKSEKTGIIPGSNVLLIGKDEPAGTMTVKVTSAYDDTVSGTATVTVS